MEKRTRRRAAIQALGCLIGVALWSGCQPAPSSLTSGRNEPKQEYAKTIAAAQKVGLDVRADETGEVTYLDFYGARDVPSNIEYVEKFPHLKMLNFSGTNLTDAEMAYLSGAEHLEELGLHGTEVTDVGLAHIAGLKNLKVLNLNDTQVGDDGLAHLEGLTNLRQIRLQSTKVTDAGLSYLAGLENLELVWISGTDVTEDAAEQLAKALPSADVVHEEISDSPSGPLLPASAFEQ